MSDATAAASEAAAKDADKQASAPAKGSKKTLLIIIAAVVVALGAGGGAVWFFMNKGHADEEVTADADEGEHEADASEETSEKGKSRKDKKGKKGKAAEPKLPAIYVEFEPPFVVNFDAKGVMRFLQVSIQVMTRDRETSEMIKAHDPKIRTNMLLLLGSQTIDTISTMEAKDF